MKLCKEEEERNKPETANAVVPSMFTCLTATGWSQVML